MPHHADVPKHETGSLALFEAGSPSYIQAVYSLSILWTPSMRLLMSNPQQARHRPTMNYPIKQQQAGSGVQVKGSASPSPWTPSGPLPEIRKAKGRTLPYAGNARKGELFFRSARYHDIADVGFGMVVLADFAEVLPRWLASKTVPRQQVLPTNGLGSDFCDADAFAPISNSWACDFGTGSPGSFCPELLGRTWSASCEAIVPRQHLQGLPQPKCQRNTTLKQI